MIRRSTEEIDRLTAQYEREIERLIQSHESHTATLVEQINMLQRFINPQMESTPAENQISEEQEHLQHLVDTGMADPTIYAALEEVGLAPHLTVEHGTD